MTALVVRADSRTLPLADSTVDLVVTSPPYFGLRSYQDGGQHYAGQVGDEATPAEFVAALLAVTAECVRVLKPTGSIWVNLGDKYVADNRGSGTDRKRGDAKHAPRGAAGFLGRETARQKSLMGLPWRYALACIDDLGLILRAEVIWSKPNGLPESVTDRVRRSHEQWFHFTKEPRYFSAVDEVREAYTAAPFRGQKQHKAGDQGATKNPVLASLTIWDASEYEHNPLGKLPGSVWTIPTQPLQVPAHLGVDHFAAFPMEWPRRIIRGWSPSGICVECGEGRRPVTEAQRPALDLAWRERQGQRRDGTNGLGASSLGTPAAERQRVITGEVCACPTPDPNDYCFGCGESNADHARSGCTCPRHSLSPTRPAVVLDPFGGTGTTALVASVLGRTGISVDLSHDYSRLARWRTTDPAQRAAAMQVDKPPAQVDGQGDLFGDVA